VPTVVQRHGSMIDMASKLGVGAVFACGCRWRDRGL